MRTFCLVQRLAREIAYPPEQIKFLIMAPLPRALIRLGLCLLCLDGALGTAAPSTLYAYDLRPSRSAEPTAAFEEAHLVAAIQVRP